MAELTRREKLIVHIMYTLLNPQLEHAPFEARRNTLYAMLPVFNIETDDNELKDLVDAANDLMLQGQAKVFGILGKHGNKLKGLKI